MDFTEYTAAKNKFIGTPNLCDLFKLLAIETWKRIEYAYIKPGIKVFETTVTQNLIFSINAYNEQYGLNIDMFEAQDERTNGNDFELIIRYPETGLEYYTPIQAKKIYRNGEYTSMNHGDQIESLMKYADSRNAKPLYLLYNFIQDRLDNDTRYTSPYEWYGCTLVDVNYLYNTFYNQRTVRHRDGAMSLNWIIPNFYDLHPEYAFPWHELVCAVTPIKLYDRLRKRNIIKAPSLQRAKDLVPVNSNVKHGFFPIGESPSAKEWISIKEAQVPASIYHRIRVERLYTQDASTHDATMRNNEKEPKAEKIYPEFSPKSRIVLTKTMEG